MQERHSNQIAYFKDLSLGMSRHQIPFVNEFVTFSEGTRVLEIGCGKGGNLEPFLNLGCTVTGVDIKESSITTARELLSSNKNYKNLTLIADDIYNMTVDQIGSYDFIFMKDVIEHIPNQERFMSFVKNFLNDDGHFFLAFPPWHMPFGGHQQICRNKFLSVLPYFHLLPNFLYVGVLKLFGEKPERIDDLLEIKETRITIDRFERIVKAENFILAKRQIYFINPSYQTKFNLKPRKQNNFISNIPWFRNFVSTCAYYVLKK